MEELTILDMQAKMNSGAETARSLTEAYLARIEQVDRHGPALNSVIELNPDALAIAEALDAERKSQGARGPLHGIPLMLKDNLDTGDRMATTAGSLALAGSIAPEDSFVAHKLRAAGAILLAKTNLSEWASFRSTYSTSGWSSRGGLTLNPYAPDRNPCGSSSGSGAAVAANLCAAAIGTETDGSIVCPAHANSLVGLKPTLGLISRFGIIPIAHSQDTAGPMTRTVADAAILLGALAGVDPRDPATAASRGRALADYTAALDAGGLRGARLGVARNFFGFSEHVDRIMEACLDALKGLGAELVDPANVETNPSLTDSENEVLLYEFKAGLNDYLRRLGPDAPIHSLSEIIAFNDQNRDTVMPHWGQDLMLKAEAKGPLTDEAYLKALEFNQRVTRAEGLDATLEKHQLDAIVAPTGGPAWLNDFVNGDHYCGGTSTYPAVAGYPNLTAPAGYVRGLPVGISFIGRPYQEATLLRLAYAFEQGTKVRRPPQFAASVAAGQG